MFGDLGHGGILFIIASILCLFYTRLNHAFPSLKGLLGARYTLLLMGMFAAYCGFIYNDFMALPVEFFHSCYNFKTGERLNKDCIYPMGADPVWY